MNFAPTNAPPIPLAEKKAAARGDMDAAENYESIHNHNAYACIERRPEIRIKMAKLPRGTA